MIQIRTMPNQMVHVGQAIDAFLGKRLVSPKRTTEKATDGQREPLRITWRIDGEEFD